jgi:hypothetical protein
VVVGGRGGARLWLVAAVVSPSSGWRWKVTWLDLMGHKGRMSQKAAWAELLRENKIEGKAFVGWTGRENNFGLKGQSGENKILKYWAVET